MDGICRCRWDTKEKGDPRVGSCGFVEVEVMMMMMMLIAVVVLTLMLDGIEVWRGISDLLLMGDDGDGVGAVKGSGGGS